MELIDTGRVEAWLNGWVRRARPGTLRMVERRYGTVEGQDGLVCSLFALASDPVF
jgi:hypothetical protein